MRFRIQKKALGAVLPLRHDPFLNRQLAVRRIDDDPIAGAHSVAGWVRFDVVGGTAAARGPVALEIRFAVFGARHGAGRRARRPI